MEKPAIHAVSPRPKKRTAWGESTFITIRMQLIDGYGLAIYVQGLLLGCFEKRRKNFTFYRFIAE